MDVVYEYQDIAVCLSLLLADLMPEVVDENFEFGEAELRIEKDIEGLESLTRYVHVPITHPLGISSSTGLICERKCEFGRNG